MAEYGCIWLYMAVCGCIFVYGYIWSYMVACGYAWRIWLYMVLYIAVSGCIWLYMVWLHVAVYGCMWLHLVIYRCYRCHIVIYGCIAATAAAAAQHDFTINFRKTVQCNQRNLYEPTHDQRGNVKTNKCIDMSTSRTLARSVPPAC